MPCDYSKYPPNWKTEIVPRIKERANHRCEFCGLKNYAVGYRDEEGNFCGGGNAMFDCLSDGLDYPSLNDLDFKRAKEIVTQLNEYENEYKYIYILLTIAHLDHDEENHNIKDDRLVALCQQCHLRYDAKEKSKRRKRKKYSKSLFPLNDR